MKPPNRPVSSFVVHFPLACLPSLAKGQSLMVGVTPMCVMILVEKSDHSVAQWLVLGIWAATNECFGVESTGLAVRDQRTLSVLSYLCPGPWHSWWALVTVSLCMVCRGEDLSAAQGPSFLCLRKHCRLLFVQVIILV